MRESTAALRAGQVMWKPDAAGRMTPEHDAEAKKTYALLGNRGRLVRSVVGELLRHPVRWMRALVEFPEQREIFLGRRVAGGE